MAQEPGVKPEDDVEPTDTPEDEPPPGDEAPPDEEAPPEGGEPEQPKESRANREIRILRERAQAAEKAAKDAADEVARFRTQHSEAQRIAEEARRKAEMDDPNLPYEQRLFKWAQHRDAENAQKQQALELRLMDQADRAAFEAKAAVNPKYAKYKDAVETELSNARRNGHNATREQVLIYIVGREALDPKNEAKTAKQKQQAQARVAAARGQPTGARSDTGSQNKPRIKDLEERLRDVPL